MARATPNDGQVMAFDLTRKLVAEGLGTAFLLIAVVGSMLMGADLAGGNMGLALLANALATGAALVVLIMIFGPVSGAHFNPAVTLAFVFERRLGAPVAAAYMAAQLVGGIAGVGLANLMFGGPALAVAEISRSGAALWLSEGIATFGLVFVILAGVRVRPNSVPAIVGLYVGAAIWFTASTAFANPAVTVARIFASGPSGIAAADAPAFIFMEMVAALVAVFLYRWLFPIRRS